VDEPNDSPLSKEESTAEVASLKLAPVPAPSSGFFDDDNDSDLQFDE
jgi:hypothetical protein